LPDVDVDGRKWPLDMLDGEKMIWSTDHVDFLKKNLVERL
jgi:hypothetical protein